MSNHAPLGGHQGQGPGVGHRLDELVVGGAGVHGVEPPAEDAGQVDPRRAARQTVRWMGPTDSWSSASSTTSAMTRS